MNGFPLNLQLVNTCGFLVSLCLRFISVLLVSNQKSSTHPPPHLLVVCRGHRLSRNRIRSDPTPRSWESKGTPQCHTPQEIRPYSGIIRGLRHQPSLSPKNSLTFHSNWFAFLEDPIDPFHSCCPWPNDGSCPHCTVAPHEQSTAVQWGRARPPPAFQGSTGSPLHRESKKVEKKNAHKNTYFCDLFFSPTCIFLKYPMIPYLLFAHVFTHNVGKQFTQARPRVD